MIKIFTNNIQLRCWASLKARRVVGSNKKPRRRYREINHSSAVSIPVEKQKFMDFPVRAYTGVSATSEIKTVFWERCAAGFAFEPPCHVSKIGGTH